MDLTEFDFDKRIDPEALDTECLRQPELFFKYAEKAIEAKGEVDRLELRLDLLRAEVELKIRKHPEKYGLEKATDASVKSAALANEDYLKLHEEWFVARENAALLDAARNAMELKKRMLESLITLHGQQYFAGPSAPRDLKSAWMAQQADAADRVNRKQQLKVRKRKKKEDDP